MGKMHITVLILMLIVIGGCSTYNLAIPTAINRNENVRVVILPFEDLTNQYDSKHQLEKKIAEKITNEFKGIRRNPYTRTERPLYVKTPNPYIVEYLDSVKDVNKDWQTIIEKNSADVIVKGTIERIDYTNLNSNVLAGYLAFGLIGAAAAQESNLKVAGFIGLRLEFINPRNGATFLIKTAYGQSDSDYPEKLARERAIEEAVDSAAENVLELFSMAE